MARLPARKGKAQSPGAPVRKDAKYLLSIPEDLRREIRIEAINRGVDMSTYICSILMKRSR